MYKLQGFIELKVYYRNKGIILTILIGFTNEEIIFGLHNLPT